MEKAGQMNRDGEWGMVFGLEQLRSVRWVRSALKRRLERKRVKIRSFADFVRGVAK
jgi:hypothetical protein